MSGPAGVTALVLGETVAGALAVLFLTPMWNEVKRGFFKLTGAILAVLALGAWFSTRAAAEAAGVADADAGRLSATIALALTVAIVLSVALLFARREALGRAVGIASIGISIALLVAMAGASEGSHVVAFLQLLAGAAFLGSVLAGLLLGHWYLTDRGLSRTPILRATALMMVGVVLEAVAIAVGGFGPTSGGSDFNPLLTSAGLASWIALGMVGTTALIAVLTRLALRGERSSAVQAATGFFYLAVITATTAEFAAKVRFLP